MCRSMLLSVFVACSLAFWLTYPASADPSKNPEHKDKPLKPAAPPGKFPRADIFSTQHAPKIDGVLDDKAWKGKRLKGAMLNVYTSKVAKVQSRIYVTYDDKYLYIAFDLDEPQPAKMVARQTDPVADHDGLVWEDDSVEIFLDPADGKKGPIYFHLMGNSKNVLYDAQVKDHTWESRTRLVAKVHKDRWTVEMAVPLSDLGVAKSPKGKTWLANFCRNRQVTGETEDTSWSDVGEEFHRWERYGHITFK